MPREKVTITLDRGKASSARDLTGAASTSEAIDLALTSFIRHERLRRDAAAYRRLPSTAEEIELADMPPDTDLDDDIDWEQLYSDLA